MSDDPHEVQPLWLHGTGLLSKWGFSDGDLLIDWAWDNLPAADAEKIAVQHHDLLIEIVQERLVPKIAGWDVDITELLTIHNPIRARKIDGAEVDWRNPDFSHPIKDIVVEVSGADVLKKARVSHPESDTATD